jgi:hypothetical protein
MSQVQQQKTITSNAIASLQLHFDAAEITDVLGLFHDIDYDYCVHAHKLKLAYLKLQLIIKQLHLTLNIYVCTTVIPSWNKRKTPSVSSVMNLKQWPEV